MADPKKSNKISKSYLDIAALRRHYSTLQRVLKSIVREIIKVGKEDAELVSSIVDDVEEKTRKGIYAIKSTKIVKAASIISGDRSLKLPTSKAKLFKQKELNDQFLPTYSYKELSFNPITRQFFVITTGKVAYIDRENAKLLLKQILSTNSKYIQLPTDAVYLDYRFKTNIGDYFRLYSDLTLENETTRSNRGIVIFSDKYISPELSRTAVMNGTDNYVILFETDGTPYIAEYDEKTKTFKRVLTNVTFSLVPKIGYFPISANTESTFQDASGNAVKGHKNIYYTHYHIDWIEKQNSSSTKYRKIVQTTQNSGLLLRPKITLTFKDSETNKDIPLYFSPSEGMLRQEDAHTRYSSNQHYLLTLFEIKQSGIDINLDLKAPIQAVRLNKYGRLAYLDPPFLVVNDSQDRELTWNQKEALKFYFLSMVETLDHLASSSSVKSTQVTTSNPIRLLQQGHYSYTNTTVTIVFNKAEPVSSFSVNIPDHPSRVRVTLYVRTNSSQSWEVEKTFELNQFENTRSNEVLVNDVGKPLNKEFKEFKLEIVDAATNQPIPDHSFNENTLKLEFNPESTANSVSIDSVDVLTDAATNSFTLLRPMPKTSQELAIRLAEVFGVEAPTSLNVSSTDLVGTTGDHEIYTTWAIGVYDSGNIIKISYNSIVKYYRLIGGVDYLSVTAHEFAHYLQELTGLPWPIDLPQATKDEYSNIANHYQGDKYSGEGFAYYLERNWRDLILVKTGISRKVKGGTHTPTQISQVSFSPIQGVFIRRNPIPGESSGVIDLTPAGARALLKEVLNSRKMRSLAKSSNGTYVESSGNSYEFDPRTGELVQILYNYSENIIKFSINPVKVIKFPPKTTGNKTQDLKPTRIIIRLFNKDMDQTSTQETLHFVVRKDGTIEQRVENVLTKLEGIVSTLDPKKAYITIEDGSRIDNLGENSIFIGLECDSHTSNTRSISNTQINNLLSILGTLCVSHGIDINSIIFISSVNLNLAGVDLSDIPRSDVLIPNNTNNIKPINPVELQDINYIREGVSSLIKAKVNSSNSNQVITQREINEIFNGGKGVPADPYLKYKTIISRRLTTGEIRLFGVDKTGNETQLLESELPGYYYWTMLRVLERIGSGK
jgi:hypothetical protein